MVLILEKLSVSKMDELLEEQQDQWHREQMAKEFDVDVKDFNSWVDDWNPSQIDGIIILEINESAPDEFIEEIESRSNYEHRKNFIEES